MEIVLHQFEDCPYCRKVRRALNKKGLSYTIVPTPKERKDRTEVYRLSGQYKVPVATFEGEAVWGSDKIVDHINNHFEGPNYEPDLIEKIYELFP